MIAVILIAAFAATALPGATQLFIPSDPTVTPATIPWLQRLGYTIETVIPVLDLGERTAWEIDTTAPYAQLAQALQYVLDLLGWVLGLLVVAAVSGVARRE
jgi:hypothetical protein